MGPDVGATSVPGVTSGLHAPQQPMQRAHRAALGSAARTPGAWRAFHDKRFESGLPRLPTLPLLHAHRATLAQLQTSSSRMSSTQSESSARSTTQME
eukprot:CAMPEP_0174757018 /NCGR_PEP_ID=MMETSP1094-20130205/107050_1 /TAXON_ID=156173 /ORGANISM="Chrysochromulina brevifilum, Strain UTEX LB 985" /LENGTH=96 /DNA_ID=CAMNT_0015962935 /DNA_START=504 /DNA_END=794 /DNA_ORIENTATION=-